MKGKAKAKLARAARRTAKPAVPAPRSDASAKIPGERRRRAEVGKARAPGAKRPGASLGHAHAATPARVKICGLTRVEDALEAERLGADAIGLNFWPGSKRYVSPAAAARIIRALSPFVLPVGVFVDASREEIERIIARTGIRAIQLHGKERPRDCRGFGVPVIKALPADGDTLKAGLGRYAVSAFLFDTPSAGHGGSGRTFDWELLGGVESPRPFLLAGGLHPDNVAEAVRAVRPYGVDVASGVESAPGIKDPEKMRRFIAAAKEA